MMDGSPSTTVARRRLGRYTLFGELASGGMATVHIGRLKSTGGFGRTVAIKRLHAQFAKSPEFVSMFLDEARLASRIRHPNVVSTLDIIADGGELFLVLDFVLGESVAVLLKLCRSRCALTPPPIASAVMIQTLLGLQAAHDARNERGEPLQIVHRDVSPQNILVGTDGIARVLDFGVAKASARLQTTRDGQLKGKLGYMSPEQLRQQRVDHRTDIFAASIVLWEMLTGHRLFGRGDPGAIVAAVLAGKVEPASALVPSLPSAVNAVLTRGLETVPEKRFQSAFEMAKALETALPPASSILVGEWVQQLAADQLRDRSDLVHRL